MFITQLKASWVFFYLQTLGIEYLGLKVITVEIKRLKLDAYTWMVVSNTPIQMKLT